MPTYEYECTSCHYRFEKFQHMKDDPITECPECKGLVKRLIGAGMGIIFKGSGFYTTDYKKSSISTSGTNGSSGNKSEETKKEEKPEAKEKQEVKSEPVSKEPDKKVS